MSVQAKQKSSITLSYVDNPCIMEAIMKITRSDGTKREISFKVPDCEKTSLDKSWQFIQHFNQSELNALIQKIDELIFDAWNPSLFHLASSVFEIAKSSDHLPKELKAKALRNSMRIQLRDLHADRMDACNKIAQKSARLCDEYIGLDPSQQLVFRKLQEKFASGNAFWSYSSVIPDSPPNSPNGFSQSDEKTQESENKPNAH